MIMSSAHFIFAMTFRNICLIYRVTLAVLSLFMESKLVYLHLSNRVHGVNQTYLQEFSLFLTGLKKNKTNSIKFHVMYHFVIFP